MECSRRKSQDSIEKHKLKWIMKTSRRHPDKVYYYNTQTKETKWSQPEEFLTLLSNDTLDLASKKLDIANEKLELEKSPSISKDSNNIGTKNNKNNDNDIKGKSSSYTVNNLNDKSRNKIKFSLNNSKINQKEQKILNIAVNSYKSKINNCTDSKKTSRKFSPKKKINLNPTCPIENSSKLKSSTDKSDYNNKTKTSDQNKIVEYSDSDSAEEETKIISDRLDKKRNELSLKNDRISNKKINRADLSSLPNNINCKLNNNTTSVKENLIKKSKACFEYVSKIFDKNIASSNNNKLIDKEPDEKKLYKPIINTDKERKTSLKLKGKYTKNKEKKEQRKPYYQFNEGKVDIPNSKLKNKIHDNFNDKDEKIFSSINQNYSLYLKSQNDNKLMEKSGTDKYDNQEKCFENKSPRKRCKSFDSDENVVKKPEVYKKLRKFNEVKDKSSIDYKNEFNHIDPTVDVSINNRPDLVDTYNDNDYEMLDLSTNNAKVEQTSVYNISSTESNEFVNYSNQQTVTQEFGCKSEHYMIIDTNVWLEDINFVKCLRKQVIYERYIVIIVPFIILKELDKLKHKNDKHLKSISAIKWINKHLEIKDEWVKGQNYIHYKESLKKYDSKSPDDEIINCCLLMKEDGYTVSLLTHDINLRNIAMMSLIETYNCKTLKVLIESHSDSLNMQTCVPDNDLTVDTKEKSFNSSQDFTIQSTSFSHCIKSSSESISLKNSDNETAKNELKLVLGNILQYVMVDVYGNLWLKIVLHKPPWSLQEVLECWVKHWIAIFSDKFDSSILDYIKEFKESLKSSKFEYKNHQYSIKSLYKHFDNKIYSRFLKEAKDSTEIRSNPTNFKNDINKIITTTQSESIKTDFPNESISSFDKGKESSLSINSFNDGNENNLSINNSFSKENKNTLLLMLEEIAKHICFVTKIILETLGINNDILCDISLAKLPSVDDAITSLNNLRDTAIKLGKTILEVLNNNNCNSIDILIQVIHNFWKEANVTCPNSSYDKNEVTSYVTSVQGKLFLEKYLKDLEIIINYLIQGENVKCT